MHTSTTVINGIDSLVVGHFDEVNKGFTKVIDSLAKVAADSQEAGNFSCELYGSRKERCVYLIQE